MNLESPQRPHVTIIYRHLPQYRVDFFCRLREVLETEDIALTLVHGVNSTCSREDERQLMWAATVANHEIHLLGKQLLWQRLPGAALRTDFLIVQQESK